jgi:hypothetical protein
MSGKSRDERVMRDQLIGYLLDALEPHERSLVEQKLAQDASLRRELSVLQRSLTGLDADRGHYDPPEDLTERTMELISESTSRLASLPRMTPDTTPATARSRASITDLIVAGGLLIAASLVFIPAVSQSRHTASVTGCQNNLRQLGVALSNYSDRHERLFPSVPTKGPMAAAGIYANTLLHNGFLDNPHVVICPASSLAANANTFHVPTEDELTKAEAPKLAEMQRSMGGSYGYTLGYVSKGRYHTTKNFGRTKFALLADSPTCGTTSSVVTENHGGMGQNVLFEDGHVAHLTRRTPEGCGDDIFLNDQGEVSAGMHRDDAVIAPSPAKPIIWPVALQGE